MTHFETKSRKVKGYLRAVQKREALRRKLLLVEADVQARLSTLTGGQMAEAARVLTSNGAKHEPQ